MSLPQASVATKSNARLLIDESFLAMILSDVAM